MKKTFVRFGKIPHNERSVIYCGDQFIGYEVGVSVYEAIKENGNFKIIMPSLTGSACVTLSGVLDRPNVYEVIGDVVGTGSDGEPLLKNIKIVSDMKIPMTTPEERDWHNDPENSSGLNFCFGCCRSFWGFVRRLFCRSCKPNNSLPD